VTETTQPITDVSLNLTFKGFKKDIHIRLLEILNNNYDDDDNNNNNNNHNILVYEQFWFITKSSTEEANYGLIREILNVLKKVIVGGLFCDLEKAADCVNFTV
jgi:hypothetical protein